MRIIVRTSAVCTLLLILAGCDGGNTKEKSTSKDPTTWVQQTLAWRQGRKVESIKMDVRLREDLKLNDVVIINIMKKAETHFGISLPPASPLDAGVVTVEDLIVKIERKVAAKSASP